MDIVWTMPSIEVRPLTDFSSENLAYLRQIYASTRQQELALTDWSLTEKMAFVDHQFFAQHNYYLKVYPGAFYSLISVDKQVAGRLYLNEDNGELRIVDISLLPEFRNLSYGTGLLRDLQHYCQQKDQSLSIHVEQFNPAKNLYQRLGFKFAQTYDEVYILMRWQPNAISNGSE